MKLPHGWTSAKLGDVSKVVTGNTPPKNDDSNYGSDIPFVKPPELLNRPVSLANEMLSMKGASVARCVPVDSILVSCIGNLGKTAITNCDLAINQQINAILPCNCLIPKFTFYQTLSLSFSSQLHALSSATTVAIVNKGKFESISLRIAPLSEQHRIVEKIDALFSELHKGVEYLESIKQQLKTYRQAVLKAAFEGELTGSNWEMSTLGEIAHEIKIGPFGSLLHKADYVVNGVPVINPKHIENHKICPDVSVSVTSEKATELSSYSLMENDVVLARRGEMGRSACVSTAEEGWLCGTGGMIVRFGKSYLGNLGSLLLSSQQSRRYLLDNCNGTTMSNLNEKIVKRLPFPLIPFSEQSLVLNEIESRMSVCDKLEHLIDENLTRSEALCQSILKKAFDGHLVPQDPNDEPAEKLLERIRAERASQISTTKRRTKNA